MRKKIATIRTGLLTAAAFALAAIVIGDSAQAAGAGFAGHALTSTENECFTQDIHGGVTNTLCNTAQWCWSQFDNTGGTHTLSVAGFKPSNASFLCIARAIDQFGNFVGPTPSVNMLTSNTNNKITVGAVSVPAGGAYLVCCSIGMNAKIETFDLN